MGKTAILVDGGFFLRRYKKIYTRAEEQTPEVTAENLHKVCLRYLSHGRKGDSFYKQNELYRIFYYDCPPYEKRMHLPISGKSINFATSEQAIFIKAFFECLKTKRKVALRMGKLTDHTGWIIKPNIQKQLLKKEINFEDLTDDHYMIDIKQKNVDMKIGLDVAALAYKQQVDQIILISGDSDFLPAAKLARREGIDFVMDPMHFSLPSDLAEHIDGVKSGFSRPNNASKEQMK